MIACLSIPYFAAAVERRADSKLQQQPLAIGGQPWEARPVYAFSQEVAHQGVEIGMSLRLVQVLSPASHFMPAAETYYSKVSGEVIDVLTDFSHLIEPQELWHPVTTSRQTLTAHGRLLPARYCLDLEGLPETEALPFIQTMGRSVRQETQMEPAIGLARQKFTAQVAATVCQTSHALPIKAGEESTFLASRPLNYLPLQKEMARRLRLLGIYTLGQLTSLSLPALQEQFGPQINPFYHLASGQSADPLSASPPPLSEESELLFEGAVSTKQTITHACDQLLVQLAHRLESRALQARKVRLLLCLEDAPQQQREQTLRRPTAVASQLSLIVKDLIGSEPLTSAVSSIKIILPDLIPAHAQQLTLFEATTVSQQARRTIDNLAAKYRQSRFYQPKTANLNHPLPERRFHLQALSHDTFVA